MRILTIGLALAVISLAAQVNAEPLVISVSLDGKGAKSGDSYSSLQSALDALQERRAQDPINVPVEVILHGGEHHITGPIVLGPKDSGTAEAPIKFLAAEGETPIISGGRRIENFVKEGELWVAELSELAAGEWDFTSLWVDGERRQPARTPNAAKPWGDYPPDSDYFFADGPVMEKDADGNDTPSLTRMRFRGDDLSKWKNLDGARLVIFHSWETSQLRIANIDPAERIVTFTGNAVWPFCQWRQDQAYFIEHHFEGLDQPGEWHLDRTAGKLYYMPMRGERINKTEVIAPVAEQLLVIKGDPANGKFVENLHFEGIHFNYTNYPIAEAGHGDPQAAHSVHAAVELSGARNVNFKNCTVAHTANYGVWLREGTQHCTVEQCEISDLGAGGVRIGETKSPENEHFAVDHNTVHNNYIHEGGRMFRGGVGAWIGRASHNKVTHNEICHFRYTGVSVGWSWGYAESSANHNNIDHNHIHHIGLGQLNDMGGIYTLGISPGTTLVGNVIHDVHSHPKLYGGWGLYTDEGSTGILLENNLVYNTITGGFHQHYGNDNMVRNNILAYSVGYQVMRSREEEHNSFFFENNIVYYNNGQLLGSTWKNDNFKMDKNLYWDTSGQVHEFAGYSLEEWQARGHDKNSITADPLFVDAENGDFRLKENSPAFALGFKVFPFDKAGLVGASDWVDKPKKHNREKFAPPAVPDAVSISEDFEDTPLGESPTLPSVSGTTHVAKIVVDNETAASGKHSLKIVDAAGLERAYDPHLFYQPYLRGGTAKASFALRINPETEIYHEWRDSRSPYRVGPSLWVLPGALLRANGKELLTLPTDTWVNFEITCALGQAANGAYDLRISWDGAPAQDFNAIPCDSPDFHRLDWFGFVSQKDREQTWWLDSVEIGIN